MLATNVIVPKIIDVISRETTIFYDLILSFFDFLTSGSSIIRADYVFCRINNIPKRKIGKVCTADILLN